MEEKPPAFTVTDRRKFSLEGDLREENQATETETANPAAESATRSNVVSMPRREAEPEAKQETKPGTQSETGSTGAPAEASTANAAQAAEPEPITAEESAEQHEAYQESSAQLDSMLRQANPEMQASGPVTFEHVIQSIYLSAMIALGAGTEPGQKPRIDILGARQSIDMLGVLQEKTKGNLTEQEQTLLQRALFELRMMFLEITNAISQAAQQAPPPTKLS